MAKSKKETSKDSDKKNLDDSKEEVPSKEQVKKENKQLRDILFVIGGLVFVFLLVIFMNFKTSNFEHEGVKYEIIREGDLLFYNTVFEEYSDGNHVADHNFYLRNDPRKLSNTVPFEGDYALYKNMVLNSESDFVCGGYGAIAVANFVNVHEYFGSKVIKDENATCDGSGRYNYVQIEEGEKTKIEEYGPGCYKISVKDCEILEGTERFMVETFSVANENL